MDNGVGTTRYRYDDSYDNTRNAPVLREFRVVRKTPAGAWVIPGWRYCRMVKPLEERPIRELRDDWGARFVLDGDGKRYCHETEVMARASYGIRKRRQIQHCRNRIEQAEAALAWLKSGKLPEPDYFTFSTLGE